jgi:hypothetical protein
MIEAIICASSRGLVVAAITLLAWFLSRGLTSIAIVGYRKMQSCQSLVTLPRESASNAQPERLMYRGSRRIATGIAIALMAGLVGLRAQSAKPDTPPQRVVLVELFTSEGCSSCPPADALLRQLNGTHTNAGQLIVGISEHVTYWNSLGWSDPFSSSVYTERQNAYGERFHLDGVYTPQMVINGTEQIVGSDRAGFARAIQKEDEQRPRMSLRILSTSVVGNTLNVSFSAGGDVPAQGADLVAVLADDSDRSSVLHGENSGQTLAHVSVARSISRVARVQAAGERIVQIQIPSSFQASQRHHLILFAQTPVNGRVLGADTKPL